MSLQSNKCNLPNIERFLDEDLPDNEWQELSQHLEGCETCRDYLETHAADATTWAQAGALLKKDAIDTEAYLTNGGTHGSASTSITEITAALTPSEHPGRLGRLGIYEVTGVIGSGSTGVVLKAIDPSLDRTVAIKVLAPALASSGTARKRFERESKAAAAVIHPNVIPIHGVSSACGLSYLVMAYVGGDSLQRRLSAQGPLATQEVLRIGSQIAAGLAAAHDQGLVHRDIKPANIILEDNVERIAITDFGLARAVDDASLTHEGMIAGTPRYMSPEQAKGQSVSQQTDLFSLGSVLYVMATGRPPFRAESSYGVMRKICDEQPIPVRELNPDIPSWLEGTIDKLMSKAPEDRFDSAREVSVLLEKSLAHVQQPTGVPLPEQVLKLASKSKSTKPFSFLSKGVITMGAIVTGLAVLATAFTVFQDGLLRRSYFDNQFSSTAKDYPDMAIFEDAVVLNDGDKRVMAVMHNGQWCEVKSIGGESARSIISFAEEKLDPDDVARRLVEDLPVVMKMMGKELNQKEMVELKQLDGSTVKLKFELTKAKRRKLMNIVKDRPLTQKMWRSELNTFHDRLADQFAYFKTNNVDLKKELDRLEQKYLGGIAAEEVTGELAKLMAMFIDGHAQVRSRRSKVEQALPFLIEPIGDRFVAFNEKRKSFLKEGFPYITKIDDTPIESLIERLKPMIAKGSPQFVLRNQLREIRDIGMTRELAGLRLSESLTVELANESGETITIEQPVASRPSLYRDWPYGVGSQMLMESNLGYLRLNRMDSDAVGGIRVVMPAFKDTDGLIVDVRGNGGGTREALIELARYLMKPGSEPRIGNVCKYKLSSKFGENHLSSRFVYPLGSPEFDDREDEAIKKFMKSFKPEWEPDAAEFSDWHFLVLSKTSNRKFYDKPVVILMDQKCFSATDVFLGAFKGWPNVTLVGQPSGGGSAKSEGFELPLSRVAVRCASMASFQPDGKLYDTNGVQPDVLVEPTPDYFLYRGKDVFLEKAIEILKSTGKQK